MVDKKIIDILISTVFIHEKQIDDKELLETKIYRYYWINDLLESLESKKIKLKKPHLWNDPFENLFFNSEIRHIDGEIADLSVTKEQIFAQCWTLKKESDLMWNSYIKGKEGAKVTTTLGNLLKAISGCYFAFVKGVSYWTQNEILEYFAKPIPLKIFDSPLFTTLFIKREEFEEEQEVRLVFHDSLRNRDPKDRIKIANFNIQDYLQSDFAYIDFEPDFLFSEIVLHPQMDTDMIVNYKNRLSILKENEIAKNHA